MTDLETVIKSNNLFKNVSVTEYHKNGKLIKTEIDKENFKNGIKILKSNGISNLLLLTPYETGNNITITYHLFDVHNKILVELRVSIEQGSMEIESLTDLWDGANWHEREAYDMFGIVFKGHPNLERILQMKDSDRFPLRKSFKLNVEGNA